MGSERELRSSGGCLEVDVVVGLEGPATVIVQPVVMPHAKPDDVARVSLPRTAAVHDVMVLDLALADQRPSLNNAALRLDPFHPVNRPELAGELRGLLLRRALLLRIDGP